jgi:hypothetical protein
MSDPNALDSGESRASILSEQWRKHGLRRCESKDDRCCHGYQATLHPHSLPPTYARIW